MPFSRTLIANSASDALRQVTLCTRASEYISLRIKDILYFESKQNYYTVRCTDGTVSLDFSGKLNGRGAYICPDAQCLMKAQKAKSLERSLETPSPEEVYARLSKEMEAGVNG